MHSEMREVMHPPRRASNKNVSEVKWGSNTKQTIPSGVLASIVNTQSLVVPFDYRRYLITQCDNTTHSTPQFNFNLFKLNSIDLTLLSLIT